MWYGLNEDGKLVAVSFIQHYPTLADFKVRRKSNKTYKIVVVRVREVCAIS